MKEKYIRLKDLMKYMDDYYGIGISLEKIPTVKPTHGSCCTCQECGYGYDECICEHNNWIDAINSFHSIEIEKIKIETILKILKLSIQWQWGPNVEQENIAEQAEFIYDEINKEN